MNILRKNLCLSKRHVLLPTLPPNTKHHRLPPSRSLLLLNLLYHRPIHMPQIALRMRRRSSHELLHVRQEEILGLEEGRYLDDGCGAEDRRWEGLRSEVEEVSRFRHELV